jgi:hypothetical protein
VRGLELVDFDGDGRDEIVLRLRLGSKARHREVLNVMRVGDDDTPFVALSHEVAIKTDEGTIENQVDIDRRGNKARLTIAQGTAKGFDPESYAEPMPGGETRSALLPWETVKSRTFELRGRSFEAGDEKSWTPKQKAPTSTARRAAGVEAPPPPRPPTANELMDRVYALYRRDRGVGKRKPSFDFVTDVTGDRTPERVLVHDRDIVVFGKGFREGTSYTFITIGVADAKDIVDATARDLTGDGKAEVVVRAVLHAKASKELGGDVVERYALLIYKVLGEKLERIFGAETGRALGKNRVLGAVAFEPLERGLGIELRPARAVGWTEKTYPFPPDTTTAGGLEPLLLPWSGSTRRYVFDGSRYGER